MFEVIVQIYQGSLLVDTRIEAMRDQEFKNFMLGLPDLREALKAGGETLTVIVKSV